MSALARAAGDVLCRGIELLEGIRLPLPQRCDCSCAIPPPCWAPQPIGDFTTRVRPGNKAVLRLHVENCGAVARNVTVEAVDKAVQIDRPALVVGPFEEETVVLTLDVAAGALDGETHRTVVWVRGCQVHYLHWTVSVSCRCASSCTDVHVKDCPDLVHHWYDHFYCDRPCPHQG